MILETISPPSGLSDLPEGWSLRLTSNLAANCYALVLYHRFHDSILYCASNIRSTVFPGRRIYNMQEVLDIINDYLPFMIDELTCKKDCTYKNG